MESLNHLGKTFWKIIFGISSCTEAKAIFSRRRSFQKHFTTRSITQRMKGRCFLLNYNRTRKEPEYFLGISLVRFPYNRRFVGKFPTSGSWSRWNLSRKMGWRSSSQYVTIPVFPTKTPSLLPQKLRFHQRSQQATPSLHVAVLFGGLEAIEVWRRFGSCTTIFDYQSKHGRIVIFHHGRKLAVLGLCFCRGKYMKKKPIESFFHIKPFTWKCCLWRTSDLGRELGKQRFGDGVLGPQSLYKVGMHSVLFYKKICFPGMLQLWGWGCLEHEEEGRKALENLWGIILLFLIKPFT